MLELLALLEFHYLTWKSNTDALQTYHTTVSWLDINVESKNENKRHMFAVFCSASISALSNINPRRGLAVLWLKINIFFSVYCKQQNDVEFYKLTTHSFRTNAYVSLHWFPQNISGLGVVLVAEFLLGRSGGMPPDNNLWHMYTSLFSLFIILSPQKTLPIFSL